MDILVAMNARMAFGLQRGPDVEVFETDLDSFTRFTDQFGLELKKGVILRTGLPVGEYKEGAGRAEDDDESGSPFDPDED